MQELELLVGSNLVEELSMCHGLSQRELSELRVIAMEASKEGGRTNEVSEDANYQAIALSLFESFQISIPDFLDSCGRELDQTRRTLCATPLERVDLASLKFVVACIARNAPPTQQERTRDR